MADKNKSKDNSSTKSNSSNQDNDKRELDSSINKENIEVFIRGL